MRARFAPERLLPLAVIGGALLVMASELLDTFRFEAAGQTVLQSSTGGERHYYALLVLGAFAVAAMVVAIIGGSKPAAIALAAAGITALLIFLVIDLPDVDKVGTFDDPGQTFLQAKAQPQDGFWIELIGALVLTVCGAAMATLAGGQLRALRPGASEESRESLPSRRSRPTPPWRDRAASARKTAPGESPEVSGEKKKEPRTETKDAAKPKDAYQR